MLFLGGRGNGDEDPKFMGKKARRRSSAYKRFLGDYLGLESNSGFLKMMAAEGDSKVVFSDVVVKVNKRYRMQERVIAITDNALYNLTTRHYRKQRRIPFEQVLSVTMSPYADNFVALHCTDDRDYLLLSNRKTEMVMSLLEGVQSTQGKLLRVTFASAFDWSIEAGDMREIRFVQEETGVLTQVIAKREGATRTNTREENPTM